MTEFALLSMLHVLLFVYWLGGDLGTYYASRFVAKKGLSKEQRATALSIMMGVDQGPRICMTLILAPGALGVAVVFLLAADGVGYSFWPWAELG